MRFFSLCLSSCLLYCRYMIVLCSNDNLCGYELFSIIMFHLFPLSYRAQRMNGARIENGMETYTFLFISHTCVHNSDKCEFVSYDDDDDYYNIIYESVWSARVSECACSLSRSLYTGWCWLIRFSRYIIYRDPVFVCECILWPTAQCAHATHAENNNKNTFVIIFVMFYKCTNWKWQETRLVPGNKFCLGVRRETHEKKTIKTNFTFIYLLHLRLLDDSNSSDNDTTAPRHTI